MLDRALVALFLCLGGVGGRPHAQNRRGIWSSSSIPRSAVMSAAPPSHLQDVHSNCSLTTFVSPSRFPGLVPKGGSAACEGGLSRGTVTLEQVRSITMLLLGGRCFACQCLGEGKAGEVGVAVAMTQGDFFCGCAESVCESVLCFF